MANFTKETITTHSNDSEHVANTPNKREASGSQTVEYLVYFLSGILEILLAFRLVLKFMGASVSSSFVTTIYDMSAVFIAPFEGIFRRELNEGLETVSVFEPATLVAIIVYAIIAWGIVKLIQIFSGERQE